LLTYYYLYWGFSFTFPVIIVFSYLFPLINKNLKKNNPLINKTKGK
jgi:hypothetical protein